MVAREVVPLRLIFRESLLESVEENDIPDIRERREKEPKVIMVTMRLREDILLYMI